MQHDQMIFIFKIVMISLFIFVLMRELMCWYWKINKHIALQEKSIKNQEKIIELIMHQQGLDKFDRITAIGGRGGNSVY